MKKPEVRRNLRKLHPQEADVPAEHRATEADMADVPGTPAYVTSRKAFNKTFGVWCRRRARWAAPKRHRTRS